MTRGSWPLPHVRTCSEAQDVVVGSVFGFFGAAVEPFKLNGLHLSTCLQVKHLKVAWKKWSDLRRAQHGVRDLGQALK